MRKASIWGAAAALVMIGASALVGGTAANAATATPQTKGESYVFSAQAQAALTHCNDYYNAVTKGSVSGYAQIPAYETSSTLTYDCILETGNKNTGVSKLQTNLNACYGKGLAVDGVFGSGTYNALLQVQRSVGATVDGVYGPNTRNKMKWTSNGKASGCKTISSYQGF
ncbi:murein L,D-transpeptidase YcbB/YkuD [Curtobacterium sp. 320]|uniref:peptidoglycan-binding domain-containing protein n=1 Tax=unclassified Curtobacterium TaxID=257496 RepID=UPI00285615CE|nr:peptidoglycan-binding domain-containing protein [Curtobacterium sp. 320]MDR6573129.1 murein L,D-transpeptidase YcbB/YkuD [Curtobacterium sp. 320]